MGWAADSEHFRRQGGGGVDTHSPSRTDWQIATKFGMRTRVGQGKVDQRASGRISAL